MYKSSNTRIVKNTIYLYCRMLLVMIAGLITTRVALDKLGVEMYGVYNVIGGVVVLFSVVNASLLSSTQRFANYYQKEDKNVRREVFNSALLNHLLISFIIVALCETIGLWLVCNKLVYPTVYTSDVLQLYQLTIASVVVVTLQAPFNAMIIAHEKMNFYALVSIVEALLYVGVAYMLSLDVPSKLVFYGALLFFVKLIVFSCYVVYNVKQYEEVRIKFVKDYSMCKRQLTFSFWSFWGALGYTFSQQGLNMLLNIFFGANVNAARGIAVQVNGQLGVLSSNYQVAVNPQIVKTYACGDIKSMYRLVFDNIRISFFLNWLIVLPLLFVVDDVFRLWLVQVPEGAVLFTKIIMLRLLLSPYENPFNVVNGATGNNKVYGLVSGLFLNLTLPLCYVLFLFNQIPWLAFVLDLLVFFCMIVWKTIYLHKTTKLSYRKFFYYSVLPNTKLLSIGLVLVSFAWHLLPYMGLLKDIIIVVLATVITLFVGFHVSLDKQMRILLTNKILKIMNYDKIRK